MGNACVICECIEYQHQPIQSLHHPPNQATLPTEHDVTEHSPTRLPLHLFHLAASRGRRLLPLHIFGGLEYSRSRVASKVLVPDRTSLNSIYLYSDWDLMDRTNVKRKKKKKGRSDITGRNDMKQSLHKLSTISMNLEMKNDLTFMWRSVSYAILLRGGDDWYMYMPISHFRYRFFISVGVIPIWVALCLYPITLHKNNHFFSFYF